MPRIQYTGPRNPEENPRGFAMTAKKNFPGISDIGIAELYTRAVMYAQPPGYGDIIILFGRDILSEEVATLPWWPLLDEFHQNLVLSHPIQGGVKLQGGVEDVKAAILGGYQGRTNIARHSLISLDGLENTYIWCRLNEWVQDVTPSDYAAMMEHKRTAGPKSRKFFASIRVIDDHGLYGYVRPFSHAIVRDREVARTAEDVKRLLDDHRLKGYFGGVDAVEENT